MPNTKKREWTSPGLTVFRSEGEVWNQYFSKTNPDERTAIKKLMSRRATLPEESDSKRRA